MIIDFLKIVYSVKIGKSKFTPAACLRISFYLPSPLVILTSLIIFFNGMLLSKSYTGSLDIDSLIDGMVAKGDSSGFLLIVPTNRKVRSLTKEFIAKSPGQGVSSLNIATLTTLSRKLLVHSGIPFSIPGEAAVSVLIQQVFHELAKSDAPAPLSYFRNFSGKIPNGYLDRIRSAISEYKRHGVSPRNLLDEFTDKNSAEARKTADIALVYDLLNSKFEQLKIKDIGDIYSELLSLPAAGLHSLFRAIYPSVSYVVIRGFTELSLSEISLIDSIASVHQLRLILELDDNLYNPNYFETPAIPLVHFEQRGYKKITATDPDENNFKSLLSRHLFDRNLLAPLPDKSDALALIRAKSPGDEITLITKEIKRLITLENVPPHSIALVFHTIPDYSPIVRDKFPAMGIPFNLTDRYYLHTFAPVVSVFNHLELLNNDFYYHYLYRVINSNFKAFPASSLNDFKSVASELNVVSGYNKWLGAINSKMELLKADDPEADLSVYESVLSDIVKLQQLLSPFRKPLTLRRFLNEIENLIGKMDLPYKILSGDDGTAELNLKSLSTFMDVVTELTELLGLEYGFDKKFPLSFFLENLYTAVSSARFNITERSNYGVQVTSFNEIRGLSFDYLFVAGLYDGNIPTRHTPDIFLSSKYAKNEKRHNSEERYLFYRVISSFNKKLFLSYPLNDNKKEFVPSVFLKELQNIFRIKELDYQTLDSFIFSGGELKARLGSDTSFRSSLSSEAREDLENIIRLDSDRMIGSSADYPAYFGLLGNSNSELITNTLAGFKTRSYSISQLETYAKCPFKFFIERVLSLKTVEEPTEEIESMAIGTLLHKIVDLFYKELKKRKIDLRDCTDDVFGMATGLIFQIAEDEIHLLKLDPDINFFELEKIIGIEGNRENSILYDFLLYERNPDNSAGFDPAYFEVSFGKFRHGNDNQIKPFDLKIDNISIRGKIDRIDIHRNENLFRVIDYKLSKNSPPVKEIIEGISLQLPLYLYAAEEMLKNEFPKHNFQPGIAGLYSFNRSAFGFRGLLPARSNLAKMIIENKESLISDNRKFISDCLGFIRNYVTLITAGRFNVSQLPNREDLVCKFCDFSKICRKIDSLKTPESDS